MKYKLLFMPILWIAQQSYATELALIQSIDSPVQLDQTIPLVMPVTANGFGPHLSLDYDTQSPDGILGEGWRIQGLSSISRCDSSKGGHLYTPRAAALSEAEQDYASSGRTTAALFKNSCFALDGQQLIRISADHVPAHLTEFQLENDPATTVSIEFQQASYYDVIGKFIVKESSGIVKEYAAVSHFYVKNNAASHDYRWSPDVSAWHLSSVRDALGNEWTIDYQSENLGMLYPQRIQYHTHNTNDPETGHSDRSSSDKSNTEKSNADKMKSVAPSNLITFEYVARPKAEIKQNIMDEQAVQILNKKLAKLTVHSNHTFQGEYLFQYDMPNDQLVQQTKLKNVEYCSLTMMGRTCHTVIE